MKRLSYKKQKNNFNISKVGIPLPYKWLLHNIIIIRTDGLLLTGNFEKKKLPSEDRTGLSRRGAKIFGTDFTYLLSERKADHCAD